MYIVILKYIGLIGVFLGANFFAIVLSDITYYEILDRVDPVQGSAVRIYIASIFEAVLISLFFLLYMKVVLKKYQYELFLLFFGLKVLLSVWGYMSAIPIFPYFGLWWFWIEKIIFFSIVLVIVGGFYFYNKSRFKEFRSFPRY